jgi:hypothetical protein
MADRFAALMQKPIPQKAKRRAINKPKPKGAVDVDVKVVERSEGQDRNELLNKVRNAMVVKMSPVQQTIAKARSIPTPTPVPEPSEMKEPVMETITENETDVPDTSEVAPDIVQQAIAESMPQPAESKQTKGPTKIRLKIKKTGKKIKLGKTIRKGTITAIRPPPLSASERASAKPSKKLKFKIKGKLPTIQTRTRSEVPSSMIRIGDTILPQRLPKPQAPVNIRASAYYQSNREIFINFINGLFEPYRAALVEESKTASCERPSGEFTLMTHQQIVRDYINLFTPYRGLLIYHGLGAGKTCSSISIAEGLKSDQSILVMTPASLRQNYISELKTCGDPLFRLNQYWEFVSTVGNDALVKQLSKILNISERYINTEGGAWLVNVKKPSNFESLTNDEKIQLNMQIDEMISAKYQFINYNGLRKSNIRDLQSISKSDNPFDDKVVIIDEVHNFVSRIVNKIKKPNSLSYKLYEWLMSAENCRLVFLTGTPIINYPNEIGILFNMLRGYIKTFILTVSVESGEKIDQKKIEDTLSKFAIHDYVEYDTSSKQIILTRNPFGFTNVRKQGKYIGIKKNNGGNECNPKNKGRDCESGFTCQNTKINESDPDKFKCTPMSDSGFINICRDILSKIGVIVNRVQVKKYKALPDELDPFKAMFINSKSGEIKNESLFQKRILGLTSYFRSAQEGLMPKYDIENDLKIVDISMSTYQFGLYEEARANERVLEKRNAKKRKRQQQGDVYSDTTSTYRIFSRAFCNYVFPREIGRPMKKDGQSLQDAILNEPMDEDDIDATSVEEKIQKTDGVYDIDDVQELKQNNRREDEKRYQKRIKEALLQLEARADEFLTPEALKTYSPKFLAILTNIVENRDKLHLVYSQFRTIEGIGVFSRILEANGYTEFKIKKDGASWVLDIPEEKRDLPTFALFTGTEEPEQKEILRNIYNGAWDKIPNSIKEFLVTKGENNNHGEVIQVFMITSSGAEGISLRNTRIVHIVEPYWHPVRIEQVIGRARRICSHNTLPEEEQNVTVFMYLMKFTDEQLIPESANGLASKDLLEKDVSKIDKKTPLTSDQYLYEISNIKESINKQILSAIKGSAMDCSLHAKEDDPIVCMSFGAVPESRFTTTPALTTETEYAREEKRNLKKIEWKAEVVTLEGIKYALRRFNQKLPARKAPEGELYDIQSYMRALKLGGNPVLVGYLRIDPKTRKLKKTKA